MDAARHLPGQERCPACGAAFGCAAAQPGCPCWCADVPVPETALRDVAAAHDGCLCPACLRALAEAGLTGRTE